MGWRTEGSELKSQKGQEFSFILVIQTSLRAHSNSFPMSTMGPFLGGKEARSMKLTTQLVPSQENIVQYIHFSPYNFMA
jgi:hypothetical protein